MFERYLQDLNDPDPIKRRDAIFGLARSGDTRAIDILNRQASREDDEALSDLARKAAYHIQKIQWEQATAQAVQAGVVPAARVASNAVSPALPAMSRGERVARGYVDQAVGFRIRGATDQAIEALATAIRNYPALVDEPALRDLSSSLLDQPPDDAIAALVQYADDHNILPEAAPIRIELPWRQLGGLAIELLIVLCIFTLAIYVGHEAALTPVMLGLNTVLNSTTLTPPQADQAESLYQKSRAVDARLSDMGSETLLLAVAVGAVVTLAAAASNLVIYAVAVLLGGTAKLLPFLRRITWIAALGACGYLIASAGLARVVQGYFRGAHLAVLPEGDAQSAVTFSALAIAVLLVNSLAQGYLVHRDHRLNIARAFLASAIGNLLFALFAVLIVSFALR
ncbi:MAG TPA: hypothetical protein VMT34_12745 [Aggregatilineales bacterium]|nr:hypothetical protein [Aggregatilineales bacterium]